MKKTISLLLVLLITLCNSVISFASNEVLSFLDAVNGADTVSQIRSLVNSCSNLTFDLSSIYYKDNVYAGLIGRNFASLEEIENYGLGLILEEETEPKVRLMNEDKVVNKIGVGHHRVEVAPLLRDGVMIVAVSYMGDTLNTYDIKEGSTTQPTILDLGVMTGNETSKVIFLESMDSLKPLNPYNLFYDDKTEIYVSSQGRADGDGSRANPFGTIAQAQSYVRTINSDMTRDIRVNILPGTYQITEPLAFTEEDSGTNGYDIIYSGVYGDNLPLISGGVSVEEWTEYRDGIYRAHVPGVTEARQLYVNGIAAQRAISDGYYIAEMMYDDTDKITYTDFDVNPVNIEFEDYASIVYDDDAADGKKVASSPWTQRNPDMDITFELKDGGYYDIEYKVGKHKQSHSIVKLYIDGELVGTNQDAATKEITGYAQSYGGQPNSQNVLQYNKENIVLIPGQHTLSVKVSMTGNHYNYLLDSFKLIPSQDVECGFYISGYDLPEFERPDELELVTPILWAHQRLPVRDVTAILDEDRHVFSMDMPYYHSYTTMKRNATTVANTAPTVGTWFYIENALEFLDTPGEFWFDTENSDIYYYPNSISELEGDIYIPVSEGIMTIYGTSEQKRVQGLKFSGLEFRHGAYNELSFTGHTGAQSDCLVPYDTPYIVPEGVGYSTPSQIHIEYADNITIENCRISNLGSAGIGMTRAVTNATLRNNVINDISATAIMVGSWRYESTDATELCSDISIDNNYIRRTGQELMGCPAVGVYYAENVDITHNDIADTPYTAITVGWGWGAAVSKELGCGGHRVVGNRIDANSRILRDGAAIYTNGCFCDTGVYIAENYITDSPDLAAIYMDSGSSNITVTGNVVENADKSSVYNWIRGNPQNSVISDNFVMNSKNSLFDTSIMQNTAVVEDENWTGAAKTITDSAGLGESYRGLTVCDGREQNIRTAYDWMKPEEILGENDILINFEDYDRYIDKTNSANGFDGHFPGVDTNTESGYRKTEILTRGKYRKYRSSFVQRTWYTYDIDVPVAGRYRVEIRLTAGENVMCDTIHGYVTLRVKNNNGSDLIKIPLRGTQTSMDALPSVRIGELNLPAGANTIRLDNVEGGAWYIDDIKLIYMGD